MLVIQVSGRAHDQIAGRKMMSIETRDHRALEFLDRLSRAQNRQAEAVIFPETLRENFVDQIVGIVLVHLDFFENHASFFRNVAGVEHRMQHEIAQNIHGQRKMLVQNFNVEANAFLGGESVHVAANRINLPGDIFRRPRFRALEHHVLDKVRDAIPFRILVARARLEPYADRHRADMWHLLGDDGQSVRQHLTTNITGFFYHEVLSWDVLY